jgi:hypothetical protein
MMRISELNFLTSIIHQLFRSYQQSKIQGLHFKHKDLKGSFSTQAQAKRMNSAKTTFRNQATKGGEPTPHI